MLVLYSCCSAGTRTTSPVKIGLNTTQTTPNKSAVVAKLKNAVTSWLGKPEILMCAVSLTLVLVYLAALKRANQNYEA